MRLFRSGKEQVELSGKRYRMRLPSGIKFYNVPSENYYINGPRFKNEIFIIYVSKSKLNICLFYNCSNFYGAVPSF